jgi:hypothetical protein
MTDPTAAERARRYRARKRDAGVTSREPGLEAMLGEIRAELRALRLAVEGEYPQLVHRGDIRDAGARHAGRRDVTERHAPEGARTPARVGTRLSPLTGGGEPPVIDRDVTPLERTLDSILEELRAAPAPASAAAISDATDLPLGGTIAALAELQRRGLVRRVAGVTPADRDRWQPILAQPPAPAESPSETIACRHYREHAIVGHRRDPGSGRFRCYVCEPDIGQAAIAAM